MSKGKATRSSTATSSTPAPAPTISNDILTGRFTENDWNCLVEVEDGEEFVFELLETIVGGVLDVIHEQHVEENIIPFTLGWAEDSMIKLIDWQFLAHDKGEGNTLADMSWQPDEEPERIPLDSWGRGSVPRRVVEVVSEEDITVETIEEEEPGQENLNESSVEETAQEREDLAIIRNNPDLWALNKLREQLKYYTISADDVLTLSKIKKPDDTLHLLYQALAAVVGNTDTKYVYEEAIANLQNTKEFIEDFGPRPISEETILLLKKYVDDIKLHPDHMQQVVCPAAVGLCTWLHTAFTYQTMCNVLNVETSVDYQTLKACLIEMKSMSSPPEHVKHVMSAVVTLISGRQLQNFGDIKKAFGEPKLLDKMEQFDCRALSQGFIRKFKKNFMTHNTDELKRVSACCSILYKWCEDQIYGSGSIIVRPPEVKQKRRNLRVVRVVKPRDSPEESEENYETMTRSNCTLDNMLPHQSAAIVKAQQGRPPGQKEVEYDEKGNVVSVLKIKKLPSHRVKTKYEIIDPEAQGKRHFSKSLKPLRHVSMVRSKESTMFPFETQEHTPLPPSFVDAVQASPGVVIKQGSRVKRGPESPSLSPIDQAGARYHQLLSSTS